jgi:archaemetzincin
VLALAAALALGCGTAPDRPAEPLPVPAPLAAQRLAAPTAVDQAAPLVEPPLAAPTSAPRRILKLITLGTFPAQHLPPLAASLQLAWGMQIVPLPPIALPAGAYYPARKRYRADKLNAHLERVLGDNAEGSLILGLTEVDVSTTKGSHRDWGVIGLAYVGGPSGVLSLHRIRPSARDPEHVQKRVQIVAAHEVGHLLGLPHCEEPGCIMREAEGTLVHVDESDGQLGPECQARLRAL